MEHRREFGNHLGIVEDHFKRQSCLLIHILHSVKDPVKSAHLAKAIEQSHEQCR